jgi:hypothetical protein
MNCAKSTRKPRTSHGSTDQLKPNSSGFPMFPISQKITRYITISHCGRMKGCAFCFCSNSCKSESSWLPSAPQQLEKLTIGALLSLFPLVSATKKSNFRVSSLGRQMLSMFHVSLLSLSLRCRLRSVCVEHGQNYVAPWSSQWHPRQSNPVRLSCGSHHVETAEMQQPNHRPGLDPPRHDN